MSKTKITGTLGAVLAGLVLLTGVGCGSSDGGGGRSAGTAGFTSNVDNPWFTLKPGTTYVYEGTKDGKRARDLYTVTHGTRTIDGVPTRVVSDLLFLNGRLEERTTDYYTQDKAGNV